MGLVYTITRRAQVVNQPLSLGSVKAFIVEIDVTSYLSPVTIDPAKVGLSKILAIVPLSSETDQAKVIRAQSTSGVFKAYAITDGTTEVANDADAGAFEALIIGT